MRNFLRQNNFFFISLGAIPGALFRWQIDNIFLVNIIGCFILGFINSLSIPNRYKLIFGFGFCGSLTTFSGWSLQLFQLLSQKLYLLFLLNSVLVIIIGFFSIYLGNLFSKKIIN